MDLHPTVAPGARLTPPPPIPTRGLDETLRTWSGQGELWDALAAVRDPVAERDWTARDVERRAHRVLFQLLEPMVATWPSTRRTWLDALPAVSHRRRITAAVPVSGTVWSETRRSGWPPRQFVARPRTRTADTLLVTTLRWVLEQLSTIRRSAIAPTTSEQLVARGHLDVALGLLDVEPIASVVSAAPTPSDLMAMRSAGRPWRSVAPVAGELRSLTGAGLLELAERVVAPDGDLAWRLFHLAILGEVLHALRISGARVTSRRPLGDSLSGPAYEVLDADGRVWDLWFEAAGAWKRYNRASPYVAAAAGVPGAGHAIGTDLMLVRPDDRALLIECKYSWNPAVVARGGYEQVVAYATEAHEIAPGNVSAVVVGPAGVVATVGYADTLAGPIGIVPPDAIPAVIENALGS